MYYWIQEKFTLYGDNMELDTHRNNLIHIKRGDYWRSTTAYGNNDTIDINDTSITRYIWSFRYMTFDKIGMQFGINSSLNRHEQRQWFCYSTDGGHAYSRNGYKRVSDSNDQEGIIHLILDVLEDKLLISRNDKKKEYVVADNIDLKNNKYNMVVSGPMRYAENIELILFKIVQR